MRAGPARCPGAGSRRFTRALGVAAIMCAGLVALWFWASWPGWVAVARGRRCCRSALLLAADRYRSLGHAFVDGFLVTRQGSVVRRRYMVHTDGIIGWNEHQSFFQRRSGVVTLHATTAAGKQSLRDPRRRPRRSASRSPTVRPRVC